MERTGTMRRVVVSLGVAAASLLAVPAVAHAADPAADCYTSCPPPTVPTTVPTTTPTTDPGSTRGTSIGLTVSGSTPGTANGSSSLPFTGTDVVELAAVGVGAVAVGGLLMVRRRRTA